MRTVLQQTKQARKGACVKAGICLKSVLLNEFYCICTYVCMHVHMFIRTYVVFLLRMCVHCVGSVSPKEG